MIRHVSDTARLVAAYRALESTRPDAMFRDPFAGILAGEPGMELASFVFRKTGFTGWSIATRTLLLDQLVLRAIGLGCDCILNLGCGFDTRPYRLPLPRSLRWIDSDLSAVLKEKSRIMSGVPTACSLEIEPVDLSLPSERMGLIEKISAGSARALVITEGLLIYLSAAEVKALSRELSEQRIAWWALDMVSPGLLKIMTRAAVFGRTNMSFAPANGVEFFEELGWKVDAFRSLYREGLAQHRAPWQISSLEEPDPRAPAERPWSGILLLSR